MKSEQEKENIEDKYDEKDTGTHKKRIQKKTKKLKQKS